MIFHNCILCKWLIFFLSFPWNNKQDVKYDEALSSKGRRQFGAQESMTTSHEEFPVSKN